LELKGPKGLTFANDERLWLYTVRGRGKYL